MGKYEVIWSERKRIILEAKSKKEAEEKMIEIADQRDGMTDKLENFDIIQTNLLTE